MLKKILFIIITIPFLALGYAWTEMGEVPRSNFNESQNYRNNNFKNTYLNVIKSMKKNSFNLNVMFEWMFPSEKTKPDHPLPFEIPDFSKFTSTDGSVKAIWFGHSTVLLSVDNFTILIDPVFSTSVSPFPFLLKRFQEPIVQLADLPKIDVILISHDHYDHLDMKTIKYFKDHKTQFIVPLGVESHLTYWGIEKERISSLDWWGFVNFHSVQFVATPSQHYSGRNGINNAKTLWASWVIKTERKKIFFSGDSGFNKHFEEIGKKFGPFDVAFIENGQYGEDWKAVHMMPEESASAGYYLNTKIHFPIHWGMFDLSTHAWNDPMKQITRHSVKHKFQLIEPILGRIYSF